MPRLRRTSNKSITATIKCVERKYCFAILEEEIWTKFSPSPIHCSGTLGNAFFSSKYVVHRTIDFIDMKLLEYFSSLCLHCLSVMIFDFAVYDSCSVRVLCVYCGRRALSLFWFACIWTVFFLFLSSAILCLPCIEIIPKDAARDQVSNVRRELETEKKQKRIVLELV